MLAGTRFILKPGKSFGTYKITANFELKNAVITEVPASPESEQEIDHRKAENIYPWMNLIRAGLQSGAPALLNHNLIKPGIHLKPSTGYCAALKSRKKITTFRVCASNICAGSKIKVSLVTVDTRRNLAPGDCFTNFSLS